jgi:hypothetical protein
MKAQLDLVEQRRRERNHREADLRSKVGGRGIYILANTHEQINQSIVLFQIDEMIAAMGQNCTVGAGMRGDQCGSKDCY